MAEPLKVGLAGLGTVGSAVVHLLDQGRDKLLARCGRPIEIVALNARTRGKKRDFDLKKFRWAADPVALASDPEIDVFVEVMGGAGDPAKGAVETALAAGKPVVTANKALLAAHGQKLAALAERKHVALNFEASVAGGIPIVKTLREGLNGASFSRIYGILNGTCNYILSRMEVDRLPFDEILRDAQRLGYAEADPTFDVEGHDTAQKLAILASLAFGTRIDPKAIYVEGISSITLADLDAASELGYRVKLLGVAVKTGEGIEQRVHPTMVPKDSAIAQVMGVTNAVTVDAEGIAPITLVGPGAGGVATASAIVADLADIARGVRCAPFGRPVARMTPTRKAPMLHHEGGYYIRLLARDRPGTAATIAHRLAQQKISLESIVQRHPAGSAGAAQPGRSNEAVPVIMTTYATSEDAVHKALAAVRRDRVVYGKPQVIRIEKN
jgi:homoserine dehydrogenase